MSWKTYFGVESDAKIIKKCKTKANNYFFDEKITKKTSKNKYYTFSGKLLKRAMIRFHQTFGYENTN